MATSTVVAVVTCRTCRRLDAAFTALMARREAHTAAKPPEPATLWQRGCTPAEQAAARERWSTWETAEREFVRLVDVEVERACVHSERVHRH